MKKNNLISAALALILSFSWLFITCSMANTVHHHPHKKTAAPAPSSPPPVKPLVIGLNQIMQNAPPNVHIGVLVVSLDTGQTLYEYHGDDLFMPASVQKLFVAISSLAYLKPTYQFKTQLVSPAPINAGVLQGDLYVKFSGDPSFSGWRLKQMFAQLASAGVRSISGHVYIDNSVFDQVPYPSGWLWDDLTFDYAAPMNGVIIDENRFSLGLSAGKNTIGGPLQLSTLLPPEVTSYTNDTYNLGAGRAPVHPCPFGVYSDSNNHYTIAGCFRPYKGTRYITLALRNPVMNAQALIRRYLQQNKIQVNGPVGLAVAPNGSRILVEQQSAPLATLLHKMLKHSDNLITDALFKTLGAQIYGQGTWINSVQAMKSILGDSGIDFKKSRIIDGAGLSRYNWVSPRQIVELLSYGYRNLDVRPTLLDALPIAGHDGTLAGRMPSEGKTQTIHAKTGSMASISGLAGYAFTQNHGPVAFAIFTNGFVGPRSIYHHFEDEICRMLVYSTR